MKETSGRKPPVTHEFAIGLGNRGLSLQIVVNCSVCGNNLSRGRTRVNGGTFEYAA